MGFKSFWKEIKFFLLFFSFKSFKKVVKSCLEKEYLKLEDKMQSYNKKIYKIQKLIISEQKFWLEVLLDVRRNQTVYFCPSLTAVFTGCVIGCGIVLCTCFL